MFGVKLAAIIKTTAMHCTRVHVVQFLHAQNSSITMSTQETYTKKRARKFSGFQALDI